MGASAHIGRTFLADVEQQVMALRALHAKLRDLDAGENFGGLIAQARPPPSRPQQNEPVYQPGAGVGPFDVVSWWADSTLILRG